MSMNDRARLILDVISTVVLTAASLAVLWTVASGGAGRSTATAGPARPPEPTTVDFEIDSSIDGNSAKRPAVALIEFSDFQCPFCGRYARDTYPQLRKDFVDTGLLEYQFRHFPLETIHPFALKASAAAECARMEGKGWEMHDRIFLQQLAVMDTDLIEHARNVGINDATFRRCIDGGDTLARIRADQAEGKRLGVVSTPTFFLGRVTTNGKIRLSRKIAGAWTYETFSALIREQASLRDRIAGAIQ